MPRGAAPARIVSTLDATKFLYSGANPIQRGVAPGAIEAQVAVLRGHVQDRAGAPIDGVRVTVLDHPELGETNTRADGAFDLAVNGGGVTLAVRASPASCRSSARSRRTGRTTRRSTTS